MVMSLFFVFLVILAVCAVVIALVLVLAKEKKDDELVEKKLRTPTYGKNLGAPLFKDDEKRTLVLLLHAGDQVWGLTPYGPQLLTVQELKDGPYGREAYLRNSEVEVLAILDTEYMTTELAEKIDRSGAAWRIEMCRPLLKLEPRANDPIWEARNRHWIDDELDDWDLLDAMIVYYFIFDGFNEPFDYYETYDVPVYEDPPGWDEPAPDFEEPTEEVPAEELPDAQEPDVPGEVTEETFEEGLGEEPQPDTVEEAESTVDAQPEEAENTVETQPEEVADTDAYPVVTEPEPVIPDPPPAPEPPPMPDPEPEPDRNWGGGTEDYGSSDSGGWGGSDDGGSFDSGGGDDW
jgi:hypothetical protein